MNQVKLEGRLTKDPELSERGETKVCDMRLAVNGPGKTPPLYIDVVAFGELAEDCAERFSKRSRVKVGRGALRYSEWEARPTARSKPQRRSKHSVVAYEVASPEPSED